MDDVEILVVAYLLQLLLASGFSNRKAYRKCFEVVLHEKLVQK